MSSFERALAAVPEALRSEVRDRWQAYREAAARQGASVPEGERHLHELCRVFAGSEFVARACALAPDLLVELASSGDLGRRYSEQEWSRRVEGAVQGAATEEALHAGLRRLRRREMVRIAWRDLAGTASLDETLVELSGLADAVLDGALDWLHARQCERFGTPRDPAGREQRLVVLGMGKLGGRELNFSSDIDLIFAFPAGGKTDGARQIENDEFFRRLGQRLIAALSMATADGIAYRVDMRLRPFGDSGPLAMSFPAMEAYYQTHGRDWERYAMIKARVAAGDRAAGRQLGELLRPFVFRRYLDYGAFESLRTMKEMIAKEVERKGMRRNVKLGPGGIREIEFIGQAFQIIYGGREPELRQRGILPVLEVLGRTGRLDATIVRRLTEAYRFLRRTENRIQAWRDEQCHDLPAGEPSKARLAFAMGYPDWAGFVAALTAHAARVSEQFAQVFSAPEAGAAAAGATPDLAGLWLQRIPDDVAAHLLGERGFEDPSGILQGLDHLRRSFAFRALSVKGRERLDRLMPMVLEAVRGVGNATLTLDRVVRLLEAILRRSVYLALLAERPGALAQLVRLCSSSAWISDHLARHPLLFDELLDPAALYAPQDQTHLKEELDRVLAREPEGDVEQTMDALRHFKQASVLRVAAADVSGTMPLMIVSDHLTEIAEVILRKVLALAWDALLPRFGRPRYRVDGAGHEAGFAILAYGKLGGIELGYGSDLDLVFLHDSMGDEQQTEGPKVIDNPSFFAKLAQRIIHLLTAHTAGGVLYDVDMRLRPSGRSGLLVSSLEALAAYQREQAWTWEHQALVRARTVAGSPQLGERFARLRHEILSRPRDAGTLRQEVIEMRARMRAELGRAEAGTFDLKQGGGGIADIEFLVQYAVLAYAHRYPRLLTYTDNIRQLDGLEQAGILTSDDADMLRDAYRALRRRIHRQKLQGAPAVVPDSELREYRAGVRRIWHGLVETE